MFPFFNQQEYIEYQYRQRLKRTANGVGTLMLVIFALENLIAFGLLILLKVTGTDKLNTADSVLYFLENALLSSVMFFAVAGLYAVITRQKAGALFPFEKIGAKRLFMLCVIGISISLMCNFAANLVTDVFSLFGVSNRGGEILTSNNPPSILMYFLTVAVIPAFTEEFAFRGVIMGSLRKYSDALALLVSSALFALMHGNFVQIPFTFCCGMVFGFLVLKTNSMLPAMIVHFLNNGISVTFDLLMKYQVISVNGVNLFYGLIFLITGIPALFFIRSMINKDKDLFRLRGANDVILFNKKLKAVASSPTIISFAVVMLLYAVYVLALPYLNISGG